jgi:ketosteroid isomerase-like protein
MSQENVEIVRRFTEAYRSGDFDAAVENLAPEIHYEVGQELPARQPDAVLGVWERWEREWETLEILPDEYIDVGDRVVVGIRYRGRGRGSGVEVDDHLFEVHTLRAGKIIRKVEFKRRSEALEAAGLPEQSSVDHRPP